MLLRGDFLSAFVRDSRVQIRIALSTFKIKEPGTGKMQLKKGRMPDGTRKSGVQKHCECNGK